VTIPLKKVPEIEQDRGEETRIKPLTEDQVKAVVEFEIQDAIGGIGSEIAEQRRKAIQYYYGREFGNEQDGRSKVILTDVADTIEWMMPTLMRMLTGTSRVVSYRPRRVDDEPAAEQATEYINYVFLQEMNGFQILHDWFKSALLEKNGIVKCYLDSRVRPELERYEEITQEQAALLLDDDAIEILDWEEDQSAIGPDGSPVSTFDVDIRRMDIRHEIRVEGVPPEEFLIARRCLELNDDTSFSAHRAKRTVSDLVSMGFDPDFLQSIPSDDMPEYNLERTERLSEDETFPVSTSDRHDEAAREIWVTECYVRIDEDGDGYTELRKVVVAGETGVVLMDDEEITRNPLHSITPVPIPHKFFGLSIADLVMDLQLIRSTLLRQMLDNLYLINNPRTAVIEGMVEIEDLLTSMPGGLVRTTGPGAIEPLLMQPLGPMAFNMLEYLEDVKENRTGVAKPFTQGENAAALNPTATGISSLMSSAAQRIELIAKIFANSGLKSLFKDLLHLHASSPVKERVFRLRGEWVNIDPSIWDTEMDVEVEVGLGVSQAAERISQLQAILATQQQMVQAGAGGKLVTPQHIYRAANKLAEAMGFTTPEMFFADPKEQEIEAPPDPKMIEAQQKGQESQAKLQLEQDKLKIEKQEHDDRLGQAKYEADLKAQIERERIASAERLENRRIEMEREKARQKDMTDRMHKGQANAA